MSYTQENRLPCQAYAISYYQIHMPHNSAYLSYTTCTWPLRIVIGSYSECDAILAKLFPNSILHWWNLFFSSIFEFIAEIIAS